MSINVLKNIKEALTNLNPQEVRDHLDRPVRLLLYAPDEAGLRLMENFFAPAALSAQKRQEVEAVLIRGSHLSGVAQPSDVPIYFGQVDRDFLKSKPAPFAFDPDHPERVISTILQQRPDLAIPLARHLMPFRQPVVDRVIKKVSKENALFSLATALPDMIPLLSLPWAIAEFASDTAILTANQIRMAFFIAAASDRPVGYKEQRGEIGSLILGAFGWRAIARELVGKIPFGGGLIPKAAIAYAATRVVGLSLDRYYRIGHGYSHQERQLVYEQALAKGKTIAGSIMHGLRRAT
jgi:hypothetical protein